jgi:hypothetical protein
MSLEPNKQAVVDALYLLVTGRGYVPQDVVRTMLASITSPHVLAALELLDDHAERLETERKAMLAEKN